MAPSPVGKKGVGWSAAGDRNGANFSTQALFNVYIHTYEAVVHSNDTLWYSYGEAAGSDIV